MRENTSKKKYQVSSEKVKPEIISEEQPEPAIGKKYKSMSKNVLDFMGVVFSPGETKEESELATGDDRRITHAIKCGLIKEV
jgi:hypothetical protein